MDSAPGHGVLQAPVAAHVYLARPYRHPIHTLAYVRIDHGNGGIIRNLSEHGMGIQAVGRLHAEQVVHLRFEIIRPRARFDLVGQVTWAEASGQAGLRFVDIPSKVRRLLKDWLFTDLLTAAAELSPAASPLLSSSGEDGLTMSSAAFHPIGLAASAVSYSDRVNSASEMPLRFSWWPMDVSPRSLALGIDALILVAAVLLFSVIGAQMTGLVPKWPVLLGSEIALAVAFGLIYRFFLHYLAGSTLGTRLAKLAAEDLQWMQFEEEQVPRFR